MKILKTIIAVAAIILTAAVPASAQFRFGPRLGTEVNSMRLNKSVFDNDNRAGFTGGLQMEFNVPVVNVGFDLSVMYVHRVSESTITNNGETADNAALNSSRLKNRDYIEIPLNFKYKIGMPLIGKVFTPYLFTGPSFSFLTSKTAITDMYKNKKFDIAWNFGVGVELISHLQVAASYGLGMTKTVETLSGYNGAQPIDGKNNYWTITAAWLF